MTKLPRHSHHRPTPPTQDRVGRLTALLGLLTSGAVLFMKLLELLQALGRALVDLLRALGVL